MKTKYDVVIRKRNPSLAWVELMKYIYNSGFDAITPKDEGMGRELHNVRVAVDKQFPRHHSMYGGYSKTDGNALDEYINQVIGETSHNTTFNYTYHQRCFHHGEKTPQGTGGYDQVKKIIELVLPMKRSYMFSTWLIPGDSIADTNGSDQPCLVVGWFYWGFDTNENSVEAKELFDHYKNFRGEYNELLETTDKLVKKQCESDEFETTLNFTTVWRNRDAGSAWLDNVNAMMALQKKVSEELSNRVGTEIKVGEYNDISLAIQIYPRDFYIMKKL